MPPRPDAPVLAVLDSEALACVAFPRQNAKAGKRAQAVLTAIERMGGRACVPAPVIAEVARTAARRAAVDHVLARLPTVATGREIATRAGVLLGRHGLDSHHVVDALVAATALVARPAIVLTGEPGDLVRLVDDEPGVRVQALP